MPRFRARAIRFALAASIALHLAAVVPFVLRRAPHPIAASLAPIDSIETPDIWAGNSPFVGGEKVVDVDTSHLGAPEPAAQPKSEAVDPPSAPAEAAPTKAESKPKPSPKSEPPPKGQAKAKEPAQREEATSRPAASAKTKASSASAPGAAGGDDGSVHPGTFGSEGQAGVRSVGRAFTRAIPPANQGDSGWASITAGTTFKAELILFVDASGHIERTAFAEKNVPPAIESLVKRTLPLIESNTLSVRGGAVVRGTEHLRLSITVSDAAGRASDELDFPFFEGGHGKASFTQPSGKHVEVEVKVVKVEVAAE